MKHIKKLNNSVGLCTFLVFGLSGCDDEKCVKGNYTYTSKDKVEECRRNGGTIIMPYTGNSSRSGFFAGSINTDTNSGSSRTTTLSSGG